MSSTAGVAGMIPATFLRVVQIDDIIGPYPVIGLMLTVTTICHVNIMVLYNIRRMNITMGYISLRQTHRHQNTNALNM